MIATAKKKIYPADFAAVWGLRRKFVNAGIEPHPVQVTFRNGVPPEFGPLVESGGDLAKLADALKASPHLFWHPMVFRIIRHLKDIQKEFPTSELVEQHTSAELRQLIEAFASGLLGGSWGLKPPGWSLKPPPSRPGRKKNEEKDEDCPEINYELLEKANELKKLLTAKLAESGKRESEDQQIHRVTTLVTEVWELSSVGHYWDFADGPGLKVQVKKLPPPPTKEIMKWVRRSFERRTETGRSVCSQLVRKMLAHRYGLREDQVRGRLDAFRKATRATSHTSDGQAQPEPVH